MSDSPELKTIKANAYSNGYHAGIRRARLVDSAPAAPLRPVVSKPAPQAIPANVHADPRQKLEFFLPEGGYFTALWPKRISRASAEMCLEIVKLQFRSVIRGAIDEEAMSAGELEYASWFATDPLIAGGKT